MSVDDWRRAAAYDGLDDLSPAALAWEFLRRNPGYRDDYRLYLDEVASGAVAEADVRRFARWGLTFAADPDLSSQDQAVFWRPDVYGQTIVLTAAPDMPSAIIYRPESWPGRYVERTGADGVHGVLLTSDTPHRLWMPAPIAVGDRVACVVPLGADAVTGASAILQFWRHLTAAAPAATTPADSRLRRARMSLRALDGHDHGASYRTLAERLFGAQRVAAEAWRTSSLRDATIRLVRTGQLFADSHYRRLLGQHSEQ